MHRPLLLIAALPAAALAACSPRADDSVANSFDRTEKAIQNTAESLESETENATRAASAALEAQANEFANRAEAVENAATADTRNSTERR